MSFSENCFKNCSSSLFENDSCKRYSLSSWMYHYMGKHVHPNINKDTQIPLELEILDRCGVRQIHVGPLSEYGVGFHVSCPLRGIPVWVYRYKAVIRPEQQVDSVAIRCMTRVGESKAVF